MDDDESLMCDFCSTEDHAWLHSCFGGCGAEMCEDCAHPSTIPQDDGQLVCLQCIKEQKNNGS